MGVLGDIYFRRQIMVLCANYMHSVGTGFIISFPAVLNPDILSTNGTSGIHATSDQASWIAGSNGISGTFGFLVVPYIMQAYGRKIVQIVLNTLSVIGFLVFVLAYNVPSLFVARIIQGFPMCGVIVSAVILGEYSAPKRRGYFLTVKKSAVPIGALLCHCLGFIWSWKWIAAIAAFSYIIAIALTIIWPESPSFLALTGKYEECEKSHTWLYGDSPKSRRELEDLISTQIEIKEQAKNKQNFGTTMRSLLKRDFMKPLMICFLLTILIDACGRYYMSAYVVQILIEVTKDKSIAAYCTIGSDVLTLTALIASCWVIRWFKRRTVLFTSTITSVILMCLTSLLIILKSRYNIGEIVYWWLTPFIILLNVFVVNFGVIPICFAIFSEIFPLEHKGMGTCITGIVFTILYAIVMKCTPIMMENTGVEGTFFIFALVMIVDLLILYFILNETKDKSLQEIEREIKGIKQVKFEDYYLKDKPLIES